ncbi:MAG: ABC transporter permease [Sphingomonadales bacterium]|nr:ABC transporter permease [Sphingomonadales bacterium]
MLDELSFAFSLLVSGLSIGLMYSLIALGFVLVYKATDAINFAQGEFVMLAGFIVATALTVSGMPVLGAIVLTVAIMILFSFALERVVLRPMLGRPVVAVIMATIGLAAILRGLPPITVGAETKAVSLPLPDTPIFLWSAIIPPIQALGVIVTIAFLGIFSWFFLKSRMGVAMRAVADNQQVALAWASTSSATLRSLGHGRHRLRAWRHHLGQHAGRRYATGAGRAQSLSSRDPRGARLHRGRHRRWPHRRSRREHSRRLPRPVCRWRHQGLRALCAHDHHADVQALRHFRSAQDRESVGAHTMLHRESGVFKTTYAADMALYPLPIARWAVGAIAVLFVAVVPLILHEYYLSIFNLVFIAIVGALGLNILVGYTGQISVGHAAFMSVGAYTAANLAVKLDLPFWITLPAGGLMAALIGALVGIPSLRIKGLYLAIATLASQLIIEWVINHTPAISGGAQASIEVPRPTLLGHQLKTQGELYYFLLFFAVLAIIATLNLVRSRIGRAFVAIRDQDIAAEIIGINIFRYKLLAFAISSFYAGVCGVLYTYYFGIANYEAFQIVVSIDYLAMIIIGGLGSVLGSILGAAFVTMLPIVIRWTVEGFGALFIDPGQLPAITASLRLVIFGGLIILFLVLEPEGLNRLWRNIRNYFRTWPFSY